MGAWGCEIREDDFVLDVVDSFEDLLKAGQSIAQATSGVESQFSAAIDDTDDDPLFWIALADLQWTYGGLEPRVRERVKADLESGRSLENWTENPVGLAKRQAVLQKFVAIISADNPRPKKPPKRVVRAPKFRAGDCLAIRLKNGEFGAALVLAEDHSKPDLGKNLIGLLDYLAPDPPGIDFFASRKWLVLTHGNWNGKMDVSWYLPIAFNAEKHRLTVVGKVEVLESDPKDSSSSQGWGDIGEQVIYQRKWDADHAS